MKRVFNNEEVVDKPLKTSGGKKRKIARGNKSTARVKDQGEEPKTRSIL